MSPPGMLSASPPVRASGFSAMHRVSVPAGRVVAGSSSSSAGSVPAGSSGVVGSSSEPATRQVSRASGATEGATTAEDVAGITAAMASSSIVGDAAAVAGAVVDAVDRGAAPAVDRAGADPKRAVDVSAPAPPGLVVGLGDPVSDILVRLDDVALASRVFASCGIDEPGGCLPVDSDEDIRKLLSVCSGEWVDGGARTDAEAADSSSTADSSSAAATAATAATALVEPTYCPGGSAANVMKGVANLGGAASFVGMIAADDVGRRYRSLLAAQNVRPVLLETTAEDAPGSAQCLSLVEKSGQRTMRTYLGASLRMRAEDFPTRDAFGPSPRLLHVEGYTLYRPELCEAAMRAAKAKGALVSLDLASFEVVRHCKATLVRILETGVVDLLFANEDEALELTGAGADDKARAPEDGSGDPEELFSRADADVALTWMLRHCRVAVVSLGARGCVTRSVDGARGVAPGARVPVVDTTGAGDSFTAGFLSAYLAGASLQACASCGCAVGTQVVQVLGAELPASRWAELAERTAEIIERDAARAAETK